MKVAVLLGGHSDERDVSIASGAQIIQALRSQAIEVVAVDTAYGVLSTDQEQHVLSQTIKDTIPDMEKFRLDAKIGSSLLSDNLLSGNLLSEKCWGSALLKDVDLYFLALHGGEGEGGTLQAALDLAGLIYTGSGPLASAHALDKNISKKIMAMHSIPTPAWIYTNDPNEPPVSSDNFPLAFPVVVKPSQQGSTVGLSIVQSHEQLADALALAYQFGSDVIIEKFIAGRELTVGVLDGKALAVGEIILPQGITFDYAAKYQPGAVQEIFPANIPQAVAKEVKSYAEQLHAALKLKGYSRSDFRLDQKENIGCLEINTLPGMTSHSLFPQSAAAVGISFPELCKKICDITLRDAAASHLLNQ